MRATLAGLYGKIKTLEDKEDDIFDKWLFAVETSVARDKNNNSEKQGSQSQIVNTIMKEAAEKEKRITNMSTIVKNKVNIKSTEPILEHNFLYPEIGELKWIGDILYQYTANGWEVFQ
jgi:hypothetical protein